MNLKFKHNILALPWRQGQQNTKQRGKRWNKEREPNSKPEEQNPKWVTREHPNKSYSKSNMWHCSHTMWYCRLMPIRWRPHYIYPFKLREITRGFFSFGGRGNGFEIFCVDVPNVFTSCPACVPNVFLEMFPIASSHFYLIPFAQSWIFMCYLSMKECGLFVLFCTYEIHQTEMLQIMFLVSFGKLLRRRRGALAWFHGIWTCSAEVLEYWMISSLKIIFNCSWKFWRNWNVPLELLERSWWSEYNGVYLVRFGFRMWGIFIFK